MRKRFPNTRSYSSKSSLSAFDFLMRLSMLVNGKIAAILSDNGSEFAKYFDEACRRLKIIHIFTRLKTPKDNAINERFNRTIQEEFMEVDEYFEPYLTESNLVKANERLTEWLIFYNFKRPHQALDYKTPFEYYQLQVQQEKLLPMYPTLTPFCKLKILMLNLSYENVKDNNHNIRNCYSFYKWTVSWKRFTK